MSSPSHPTSNIEDAFSSNFPDYIPASPDYVPASPGKTYSSSSNNSFGLVPIASPTLSLFHDDPSISELRESHTQIAKLQRKAYGKYTARLLKLAQGLLILELIITKISRLGLPGRQGKSSDAIYETQEQTRKDHRTTRLYTSYSF
ncbi:hypothetical protein Tco_0805171 [Tanacetum coccineum]